jgi:hypothetical protein
LFERNRITGGYVDTIEIKEPDLEALGKVLGHYQIPGEVDPW